MKRALVLFFALMLVSGCSWFSEDPLTGDVIASENVSMTVFNDTPTNDTAAKNVTANSNVTGESQGPELNASATMLDTPDNETSQNGSNTTDSSGTGIGSIFDYGSGSNSGSSGSGSSSSGSSSEEVEKDPAAETIEPFSIEAPDSLAFEIDKWNGVPFNITGSENASVYAYVEELTLRWPLNDTPSNVSGGLAMLEPFSMEDTTHVRGDAYARFLDEFEVDLEFHLPKFDSSMNGLVPLELHWVFDDEFHGFDPWHTFGSRNLEIGGSRESFVMRSGGVRTSIDKGSPETVYGFPRIELLEANVTYGPSPRASFKMRNITFELDPYDRWVVHDNDSLYVLTFLGWNTSEAKVFLERSTGGVETNTTILLTKNMTTNISIANASLNVTVREAAPHVVDANVTFRFGNHTRVLDVGEYYRVNGTTVYVEDIIKTAEWDWIDLESWEGDANLTSAQITIGADGIVRLNNGTLESFNGSADWESLNVSFEDRGDRFVFGYDADAIGSEERLFDEAFSLFSLWVREWIRGPELILEDNEIEMDRTEARIRFKPTTGFARTLIIEATNGTDVVEHRISLTGE